MTVRQIDIFDITDEHLQAAAAARRAKYGPPVPLSPQQNRQLHLLDHGPDPALEAGARRCDRCGIDTTRPDLCIDCLDVLALESA